ncbi:MAG TPA: RcnB family protein [Sphingomicrobium sp.]|nr:RcnB family protein [Sphingomicrobium sp.]
MRKFILLAAAATILMPGAAIAQRPHHDRNRTEVRHDRRDVRQDRRELRRDRREVRRDRHHARRHVAYVAPYRGWSYRPVTVGFRLRPVFYSPRYYVTDYGYYGLRAPRPWERWIRYGDDLLLVNLRNGRVLSVIHYRYW